MAGVSDVGPWQLQKGPDIGATSWRKQPIQLRGIAPDAKAEKVWCCQ
jgi:alanyl aminopeptidase